MITDTIGLLLERHGYTAIPIELSGIPYRL